MINIIAFDLIIKSIFFFCYLYPIQSQAGWGSAIANPTNLELFPWLVVEPEITFSPIG